MLNGSTHVDFTNYYNFLPSNQLELALWLESDRMRSLAVTQENLDNQREAVKEEKRLRYDNQPYVNGFLRLFEMSFQNPANAHSARCRAGSPSKRSLSISLPVESVQRDWI